MMQFPDDLSIAKPPARPDDEVLQTNCRSLKARLSNSEAKCERLRRRVAELDKRLKAAEAERDQANAIAEDLYDFFRKRVREVANRKKGYERPGD